LILDGRIIITVPGWLDGCDLILDGRDVIDKGRKAVTLSLMTGWSLT
jgi:hypothetical protein